MQWQPRPAAAGPSAEASASREVLGGFRWPSSERSPKLAAGRRGPTSFCEDAGDAPESEEQGLLSSSGSSRERALWPLAFLASGSAL
eukprot:4249405-Pyramimonas_sp.AAC.1